MTRILAYNALALAMVLAVQPASATDYTFQPTDGVWDLPQNWDPFGTPDGADQATIPADKTCRIQSRDEEILKVVVASGGTLRIEGHTLTFPYNPQVGDRIALEGVIIATGSARMVLGSTVRILGISGAGMLSASGPGNSLRVERTGDPETTTFIVGQFGQPRPTVKGNVTIYRVNLTNEGLLLVDNADEVMVIGGPFDPSIPPFGYYWYIWGSPQGEFKVTQGGTMQFDNSRPAFYAPWNIEGGNMVLLPGIKNHWLNAIHPVNLRAGRLEFNYYFRTTGGIDFTGGTIHLAQRTAVMFEKP